MPSSSSKLITKTEDELEDLIRRRIEEYQRINPPPAHECPCSQSDAISTMLQNVARMQVTLETNQKQISKNTEALFGNGSPGIKTQVNQLMEDMATIKRISWIVLGTVLTTVAADILYLIVTHPIPGLTK